MKIILTGGGTAGHAMVNKVLIPLLKEDDWQIVYIGSQHGAEKNMMEDQGIATYYGIRTGKLRRYLSWSNVSDFFKVWKGIIEAYQIIKKEKPNVIYSGGGFVSVPVVLAGGLLKIPILIRETDFTVGLANKICMRFAKKVFVTFPDTTLQIKKVPCEYQGIIVRPELLNVDHKNTFNTAFSNDNPVILVLGGSLGSEMINKQIWNNLSSLLCRYNILHICGKGKTNQRLLCDERYRQYEYVEDMGELYNLSDVVITRCGSNAIIEGLALGKRMVCIPISNKYSRGEQIENAQYAIRNGCAVMIEEDQLSVDTLLKAVHKVLNKPINPKLILNSKMLMENCGTQIAEIQMIST